jgi:GNAT superfamily N-acetyltransferase
MNITFRRAVLNDARFIYDLRFSLQDSSSYFIKTSVSFEDHKKFWIKNFKSYWIVQLLSTKVGFYGSVNEDFRFSVHSLYRGRGIGTYIVADAITRLGLKNVRVISDNTSSIKCFTKNQFIVTHSEEKAGIEYFILSRAD